MLEAWLPEIKRSYLTVLLREGVVSTEERPLHTRWTIPFVGIPSVSFDCEKTLTSEFC